MVGLLGIYRQLVVTAAHPSHPRPLKVATITTFDGLIWASMRWIEAQSGINQSQPADQGGPVLILPCTNKLKHGLMVLSGFLQVSDQSRCGFWQFVASGQRLLAIPTFDVLVAKICR